MDSNSTTPATESISTDSHENISAGSIIIIFGVLFLIAIIGTCAFACMGYHRYKLMQRSRHRRAGPVGFGPWIFNFGRRDPSSNEDLSAIIRAVRGPLVLQSNSQSPTMNNIQHEVLSPERREEEDEEVQEIDPLREKKKRSIALKRERMKTYMTERLKEVGKPLENDSDIPCKICFMRKCEVLLEPCGHVGSCEPCAIKIFDTTQKCPFDQQPVTGYRIAYIVL